MMLMIIIIIGGVGRMPSSQATHDGRNSPTVMNSTTLLGTLPSEVIVVVIITLLYHRHQLYHHALMLTLIRFSDNIMTLIR